jgi:hypothetical protein
MNSCAGLSAHYPACYMKLIIQLFSKQRYISTWYYNTTAKLCHSAYTIPLVLGFPELKALYAIKEQIIRSVRMFKMQKLHRVQHDHGVHLFVVKLAYQVHFLVVVHYILGMIKAYLYTKVVLIIKVVPQAPVVLWYCKLSAQYVLLVWPVRYFHIIDGKIVVIVSAGLCIKVIAKVLEMNFSISKLIPVVPPRKIDRAFMLFFLCSLGLQKERRTNKYQQQSRALHIKIRQAAKLLHPAFIPKMIIVTATN